MDLSNSNLSMTFTENNQGLSILEELRVQRSAGRFCDVAFHVNDKQYEAHRNVLAACSPYFDSIFDVNKTPKQYLSVMCQENAVFEQLLNYMYTGEVTIQRESANELLRLANYFMVVKLKEHCCEYLEQIITVSTCFSIKENADKCGCPSLSQNSHYFILCNISEVIRQNEILEFTFAKLEHILLNKLYTLRQEEKFHLILRWTKFNLLERQPFFKTLLTFINWSGFNPDELAHSLRTNDIFVNSDVCLLNLLEVLSKNDVDLRCHVDILQHLRARLQAIRQLSANKVENNSQTYISSVGSGFSNGNDVIHQDQDYIPADRDLASLCPVVNNDIQSEKDDSTQNESHIDEVAGLDAAGSDSDVDEGRSMNDISPTEDPSNAYKSGNRPHKRKGIPFKINQILKSTDSKANEGDKNTSNESKKPKRRGKPPKRFSFEDYVEEGTTHDGLEEQSAEDEASDKEVGQPRRARQKHTLNKTNTRVVPGKRGRKRKERIKCPKCDFATCNEPRLNAHLRSAHKNEDVYTCNICQFSCRWNREYYKHMKTHFTGPTYRCDYDECKHTTDRIQALLYHRMRHSNERPFHCSICDQRFRTKNNLKTHLKCHTGEKPFKCDVCSRCFATKGTLHQHSVTHSNHRPYLCELCGFSTKYQSHLILHKRIHKGEVFKCQYPNCDYSTPKRSQLGCHMRTHMQVKSHVCTKCGRGFIEKSHLVRHERIHLEDKPFKCELCDYSSTRRDKLKDHTRRHHKQGAAASMAEGESCDGNRKAPRRTRKPKKTAAIADDSVVTDDPPRDLAPTSDVVVGSTVAADEAEDDVAVTAALVLDDRDVLRTSVTTSAPLTSPTSMTMMHGNTLDTRGLGLLLPTVVAVDGRDDGDPDHFRSSLMIGQAHPISMGPDDEDVGVGSGDPQDDAFLEQTSAIHLPQLHSHSIHLPTSSVGDLHSPVPHASHTPPDITCLTSFMNIF